MSLENTIKSSIENNGELVEIVCVEATCYGNYITFQIQMFYDDVVRKP